MFGKTNPIQEQPVNGAPQPPTGIQLMLRSLGFDPVKFMADMNGARDMAIQVVENFDARLKTLEEGLTALHAHILIMSQREQTVSNQVIELCRIVSDLKATIERDITEPDTTTGPAPGVKRATKS
jgi:hypothetical protein